MSGDDDRDPRSVEARLDNASTQLEHALEAADDEMMDPIIDAIAATDAALAKETGETPHELRADGGHPSGAWIEDPETAMGLINDIEWSTDGSEVRLLQELLMVVTGERDRIRFEVTDEQ